MLTSITPLSARAQAVLTAIVAMMATLFASIVIDLITSRWPIQLGELPWRYQFLMTGIAAGPQLLTVLGFIAMVAVFTGNNTLLRTVAIVLAVLTLAEFIALPLAGLDLLQVRRLETTTRLPMFTMAALKALFFGGVSVLIGGWGARLAWLASANENPNARRKKGEGLVVGQPETPRGGATQ